MNIYFSADTHFGHDRIIRYCSRPFENAFQMEDAILTNFNSVLKPCDILYHLGDVSWSTYDLNRFFGKLNTKNVHLILGNHDNKKLHEYQKYCQWVGDLKRITINNVQVVMCHYPLRSWNGKTHGAYHAYGHCHGKLPGLERSMDVGVDPNKFFPVSLDEIVQKLQHIPFKKDDSTKERKMRWEDAVEENPTIQII